MTFCLLLCATAGEVPTLGVETTVTATMKATTAYVAFLVRGQGLLISDAQKACDANITAVSEKIKERFKTAQIDTTTVNTGTKDFQGWRAAGAKIEPDVTQLVTVTLPPDETLAAEILDIAIRKGAIPFCSDRPELLGAVYYGIDNTEAAEEQLYQEAAAKLRKEAERLANLMNSEIIGLPTDVPWAFVFERVDMLPRHPAQLYEAIAYFLFFLIMVGVARYKKDNYGRGFYFGLCITVIFLFRFFIEFLKERQVDFENVLPIDMGQILSIPFVLLGLYFVITKRKKAVR